MKQLFRSILSVAAAATLLIGCSKDATETPAPAAGEFTLNLVTGADTRTEIYDPDGEGPDGVNIRWSEGDLAAIYVNGSESAENSSSITDGIATFTGKLQPGYMGEGGNQPGIYTAQAVYPAEACTYGKRNAKNDAIQAFELKLPAAQEATTATFDKNADILVAKNMDVEITAQDISNGNKTVENYTFGRTTAVTRLNFTVVDNAELLNSTETVKNIALTVEGKSLAGTFIFDPAAFKSVKSTTDLTPVEDPNNMFKTGSNTVTVTLTDTPALKDGFTAWISTAPITLTNGDKLTFTVTTDAGTTITKTATVGKDLAFMTTKLNKMGVKLDGNVTIEKPAVVEPGANAVEFVFSKMGYENDTDLTAENVAIDPISIVFEKGSNKLPPKYYTSGAAVRAYGGNTFTVSGPEGITIKTIELTFTGNYDIPITTDPTGYVETETGLWSGSAPNVTFTIGGNEGQRRFTKIKVTYDTTSSDEPQLIAQDITAPAVAGEYEATYTINNSTEDVLEEPEVDGSVVTEAIAGDGSILYKLAQDNYTAETREGWIKLSTASGSLSKTIKVTQQASTLAVSDEVITIADGATTATFTVTSPEFIWNIDASTGISVEPNIGEPTSTPVTVTVTYEGTATGEIGNLTINRTNNDPQQKTVTVKKQEQVTQGAQNVTFVFEDMGYTNAQAVDLATKTPISIAFAKGTNTSGNVPKYYTGDKTMRAYAGNTITVGAAADAASPVTITKLEFTFESGPSYISTTSGTYTSSTATWIGSEASVTFDVTGSTRIKTIKVTYDGPAPGPETLLTPKVGATQDGTSVTLSWGAVNNATKYAYTIGTESGETTETTVTVPMAEGTYDWTVTAIGDGQKYLDSEAATGSITVAVPSGDTKTATIDLSALSAQGYKDGDVVSEITEGSIKVTFNQGDGQNPPKYYSKAVRLYGKNSLTFTGATITKIELTATTNSYNKKLTVVKGDGTYVTSGSTGTWENAAGSTEVELQNGETSHARYTKIVVTYN